MNREIAARIDQVKKYFTITPAKPLFIIQYLLYGVSAFLFYTAYQNDGFFKSFLLFIAVPLLLYTAIKHLILYLAYLASYKKAEPKPQDAQMDKWLAADREMVLETAYSKLDLSADDISAHPLMIDGPSENARWYKGKDKVLRFDHHDIILFFLTDHHVATFKCVLDMYAGAITNEWTKEFPYNDITNLETSTVNDLVYFVDGKSDTIKGTQRFSLFTSGGNQISIKYFFNKSTDLNSDYILPNSEAENTIKAIRKRLKEYKDKLTAIN